MGLFGNTRQVKKPSIDILVGSCEREVYYDSPEFRSLIELGHPPGAADIQRRILLEEGEAWPEKAEELVFSSLIAQAGTRGPGPYLEV